MFRGEAFCTPACECTISSEHLSVLEAITSPDNERQVSDVREVYAHLSTAFSQLSDGTCGAKGVGLSSN